MKNFQKEKTIFEEKTQNSKILTPILARGLKNNMIEYTEDHTIIFISSTVIVEFNIENEKEKIISNESNREITAITRNKKQFSLSGINETNVLIIAERDETISRISILSLKNFKALQSISIPQNLFEFEIFSIVASKDSNHFACLASNTQNRIILMFFSFERFLNFVEIQKEKNPNSNSKNKSSSLSFNCSFRPKNISNLVNISVCGDGELNLFKFSDSGFKKTRILQSVPKLGKKEKEGKTKETGRTDGFSSSSSFSFGKPISHSWWDENRIIVGTETGNLVCVDLELINKPNYLKSQTKSKLGIDLIYHIDAIQENLITKKTKIQQIICHGNGLILVINGGFIQMLSKKMVDEKKRRDILSKEKEEVLSEQLKFVKQIRVKKPCYVDEFGTKIEKYFGEIENRKTSKINIKRIVESPKEGQMVLVVEEKTQNNEQNSLVFVRWTNFDLRVVEREEKSIPNFHCKKIVGVDCCLQRPVFITVSNDKTVKIWNYEDGKLVMTKEFAENPFSVSFHPSGLMALVGFSDKLRLFGIHLADMRIYKEFLIRKCEICSFSEGGQFFAAGNFNEVKIFSTWDHSQIACLKGHTSKITDIRWGARDLKIITCGSDGAIYVFDWMNAEQNREVENVVKISSYYCVEFAKKCGRIFAGGSPSVLREIDVRNGSIIKEMETEEVITDLVVSELNGLLFAGTERGRIKIFKMQNRETKEIKQKSNNSENEQQEYTYSDVQCLEEIGDLNIHHGSISQFALTPQEDKLISVSEDGSIFIFSIKNLANSTMREKEKDNQIVRNEILVSTRDLEEMEMEKNGLVMKIEDQRNETEHLLNLEKLRWRDERRKMKEENRKELEKKDLRHKKLKQAFEESKTKNKKEMEEMMQKNEQKQEVLLTRLNQSIQQEKKRIEELEKEKKEMEISHANQVKEMEKERKVGQNGMEEQLKKNEEIYRKKVQQLKDEQEEMKKQHEKMVKILEEDADEEIQHKLEKQKVLLENEREEKIVLKGDLGILKKKLQTAQHDVEMHVLSAKKMNQEKERLLNTLELLNKQCDVQKKEIEERNKTISDKNQRIEEMKQSIHELEKNSFVLDYKSKELKKQIEPKKAEIDQKNEIISNLEKEISTFEKLVENQKIGISDSELKIKSLNQEVNRKKEQIWVLKKKVENLIFDLKQTTEFIQNPSKLKKEMKEIYKKYLTESNEEINRNSKKELNQKENRNEEKINSLIKIIENLKKRIEENEKKFKKEKTKLIKENLDLIKK
ncbi:cilia- and flagella-associated protein [Anaeramoeba ignava]|uniref:Cilia- and flagella-associated protein n=1 Tax=Anaeramoeba ignava TaxID=1746090 RepID=A0A9Q0RBZ4_ANAIG|nr:cilia- and flagella-associated protein [Anaeramoeba ignava]